MLSRAKAACVLASRLETDTKRGGDLSLSIVYGSTRVPDAACIWFPTVGVRSQALSPARRRARALLSMLQSRQLLLVVVVVGFVLLCREALPLQAYSHAAPLPQRIEMRSTGRRPEQLQYTGAYSGAYSGASPRPVLVERTQAPTVSRVPPRPTQPLQTPSYTALQTPSTEQPAAPQLESAPAPLALTKASVRAGAVDLSSSALPAELPNSPLHSPERSLSAPAVASKGGAKVFIALGIVSNVMWQNSFERRRWVRETFMTYPNVGQSMPTTFIIGMLQSDLKRIPKEIESQLDEEQRMHKDVSLTKTEEVTHILLSFVTLPFVTLPFVTLAFVTLPVWTRIYHTR